MKKINFILVVGIALSVVNANAVIVIARSTLDRVYPHADGEIRLTVTNAAEGEKCLPDPQGNRFLKIRQDQQGVTAQAVKNMLATALAAKVSKSEVSIYFEDSNSSCYVSRLSIN